VTDWRKQYEDAAEAEARRWARRPDRDLLDAIRRRKCGDYYVVWYELAKRPPTAESCWLLYDVLLSDRPYLDRYHGAAALLALLRCEEFEEAQLSADWPEVPANLVRLRAIVESKFGPRA
jgi:hypothetical protein